MYMALTSQIITRRKYNDYERCLHHLKLDDAAQLPVLNAPAHIPNKLNASAMLKRVFKYTF